MEKPPPRFLLNYPISLEALFTFQRPLLLTIVIDSERYNFLTFVVDYKKVAMKLFQGIGWRK